MWMNNAIPLLVLVSTLNLQTASPKPPSVAADEAAVAAMKVSAACADAAEHAWQINGYAKEPMRKTDSETLMFAHSNHYSHELGRCLIKITTTTINTKENYTSTLEEVWDAIEQMSIGSLFMKGDVTLLTRSENGMDKPIPATPTNISWFRNLMLK
jgi:hypothetical protein